MKKALLLTLVAATFLSLGTAFAQNNKQGKYNFYEVVPKHEFFIEGFGGLGPIIYWGDRYEWRTDTPEIKYERKEAGVSSLWPWMTRHYDDMFSLKALTGLGYGGGFGYIAHITPVVGIMTGAEYAVYNSGFNTGAGSGAYKFAVWTAQALPDNMMRLAGIVNYNETQKYTAIQVPLMLHLMAPMGKGKNFFYAALGAKVGFNIPQLSSFHGWGDLYKNSDIPDVGLTWNNIAGSQAGGYFADIVGDGSKTTLGPDDQDYLQMLGWTEEGYLEGVTAEDGKYDARGRLGAKLVNPMASLELGFRWRFGGGWGLYTGLYADFGILPLTKPDGAIVKVIQNGDEVTYEPQSFLCCEGLPTYHVRKVNNEGGQQIEMLRDNLPAAADFTRSFQAGIKMKLAFGKVKKRPAPIALPPKPDTVVKTVVQTVVVRDTVTKQNTVVVRDTVEKVKVVRDTVIVIKEVPQEIKDVMVELSNTLFAFDKFNLTDKAREGLNKVAKWLNDNPDVNVEISGHTDSVGSDSYNQKLSEQRAQSVYEYFIHEGGVSSKRLSYKGYGKSRPIATNDTAEGRQQNRRVELNIIQ